jgi:hypothetical protein
MNLDNILNGNLKISSINDSSGRIYYKIQIAFSDNDILTVYRNSIFELLEELPVIISSAIQARIITDDMVIN